MCTVSCLILEQMLVATEAHEKGLDPGEGRKSSSEDNCQVCTFVTHSSVLAWRIPGTGEPGGLPSMGVTQSRTGLKLCSSSSSSSTFVYNISILTSVTNVNRNPQQQLRQMLYILSFFFLLCKSQWNKCLRKCLCDRKEKIACLFRIDMFQRQSQTLKEVEQISFLF